MKLILSRKGFDSGSGGYPSPIFPDDSMVSLPIPFPRAMHCMHHATSGNSYFARDDVLENLTRRSTINRHDKHSPVHLDPYLKLYGTNKAPDGWRPAFGQDDRAQRHLSNEGVSVDDLFLFFGWFRRVWNPDGIWDYVPDSPHLHVIFGWLQVQQVLNLDVTPKPASPPWLADHPHVLHAVNMKSNNTVYIAKKRLVVEGKDFGAGGGTFDSFSLGRQLTGQGADQGRSLWHLPLWFHPDADTTKPTLSHHRPDHRKARDRWSIGKQHAELRSVARGQEFVIELDGIRMTQATAWLKSVFRV